MAFLDTIRIKGGTIVYGITHILIDTYLLFIWRSNKSTSDWLKTNWSNLFQRSSLIKSMQYLAFYTVHLCKQGTGINCTDRSIWKVIIILLLSSPSVLKMTIWNLTESVKFWLWRLAPTHQVFFNFIDVVNVLVILHMHALSEVTFILRFEFLSRRRSYFLSICSDSRYKPKMKLFCLHKHFCMHDAMLKFWILQTHTSSDQASTSDWTADNDSYHDKPSARAQICTLSWSAMLWAKIPLKIWLCHLYSHTGKHNVMTISPR